MEFTRKGKGNMTIWNYHLVILLEYPPPSWSVRTERATLGWTMMETKTKFKMIEQNRTMLEPNPIFLSLVGVDLPTCKYRKNEEWFSDLGHVIAILHTETEPWVELSTFYVIIPLILYVWRHSFAKQISDYVLESYLSKSHHHLKAEVLLNRKGEKHAFLKNIILL